MEDVLFAVHPSGIENILHSRIKEACEDFILAAPFLCTSTIFEGWVGSLKLPAHPAWSKSARCWVQRMQTGAGVSSCPQSVAVTWRVGASLSGAL